MHTLTADTDNLVTFTPDTAVSSVSLSVTDASTGDALDLGQPTLADGAWSLTVQAADLPDTLLYHTLAFAWTLTTSSPQTARVVEYYDVVPYTVDAWLVTLDEARAHARLDLAGDDEHLFELLVSANALVEAEVGCGLASMERTERVTVTSRSRSLRLINRPVIAVSSVIDPFGDEWDDDGFYIDATAARLRPLGAALPEGTWTVTYTGGLEADYRWDSIRRQLAHAVTLAIVDAYDNRDARATSESAGDVSHSLENGILPHRAAAIARRYFTRGL